MKRNPLLEHLQQAIDTLNDAKAVWIYRRDAAEMLGMAAAHATAALKTLENEHDKDVRMAVHKALAVAAAGLDGVTPDVLAPGGYALEALARACEKPDKRTVAANKDGFEIEVLLDGGRRQKVYLAEGEAQGGAKLIRVYTTCGTPTEKTLKWALQLNLQFPQGALALAEHNGEQRLVMVSSYLATETSPAEIVAGVKAVAYYGDWIERKLSNTDVF